MTSSFPWPAWKEDGVVESGEAEKKVGSNFSVQSHANVHSRGSACSAGHVDIGRSSRLNTATFTTPSQRAATASDVAALSMRPGVGPQHRASPQRRTALGADQSLRERKIKFVGNAVLTHYDFFFALVLLHRASPSARVAADDDDRECCKERLSVDGKISYPPTVSGKDYATHPLQMRVGEARLHLAAEWTTVCSSAFGT